LLSATTPVVVSGCLLLLQIFNENLESLNESLKFLSCVLAPLSACLLPVAAISSSVAPRDTHNIKVIFGNGILWVSGMYMYPLLGCAFLLPIAVVLGSVASSQQRQCNK
jgi:hypothetical protein